MTIKKSKPTTPAQRQWAKAKLKITRTKPERSLTKGGKRSVGRSKGKISTRHKGGAAKRLYRSVDFKRDKTSIPGVVKSLEYDPNRSANIALVFYRDGEKRYIIAPSKIKIGDEIVSGEDVPVKVGNAMKLGNVPVGTQVHNVELIPGRGGQMARSAGSYATVSAKEPPYVHLKMPSGEVRRFREECMATVGQVSVTERKLAKLGKAGRKRHMGIRPSVRGVAMHPGAHPHGGGEGKSGIGMPSPKSPWGKPTLGKKTRRRRHTGKYIVKVRRER